MANKSHQVFEKVNMHGGDTSVCWEWTGGVTSAGRPCFDLRGKKVVAYRLVYELVTGDKIPKGMVIRHKCDNGICCNPTHLEMGTHKQNMEDMKERSRHGLPAIAVKAIKRLLEDPHRTHEEIAALYGVDRSTIGRIARGEAYESIEDDADQQVAGPEYEDEEPHGD